MRTLPTKQSSVLGLPIGRRRTDWARVGKLGAMGLGTLSTAVGGVGAKRAGGSLKQRVTEKVKKGEEKGGGGDKNVKKLRLIIKEGIDVGVPIETAYDQWTQFTELPSIMKAPQTVEQEEDDVMRWVAKIGPSRRRWTATILEQKPDERIVWESADGTENRGVVTFHQLDRNLTRVQVEMEYFPHGFVEKVGNIFLAARRRTRKDLRLFKHFLELAGSETGAWRGEIASEDESEPEGQEAAQMTEREGKGNGRRAGDAGDRSREDEREAPEAQRQHEDEEYEQDEEYEPEEEDEEYDYEPEDEEEEYEPEEEEADEPERQPVSPRIRARRRAPGRPRRQRA